MEYTKNPILAIVLVLLFVGAALAISVFWNNHSIVILVAVVWVSTLILRNAFSECLGKRYSLYVINFLILYAVLNIGNLAYDYYINYKLAQFDINHDQVFSVLEQTAEQRKYEMLVINDVGRNLMPVTSLFLSFGSSVLFFWTTRICSRKNAGV